MRYHNILRHVTLEHDTRTYRLYTTTCMHAHTHPNTNVYIYTYTQTQTIPYNFQ